MANLLVIHQNNNLVQEQEDVLNQLLGWNIHFLDTVDATIRDIDCFIKENDVLFLLYAKEFDPASSQELLYLHNNYPLLQTIYYFSQLKSEEFAELAGVGIDYCIIGDARQINLIKKLKQLWESHWKRIPESLLIDDLRHINPRAKRMINILEISPIRYLNTFYLADQLNISESHFRMEFKKYFGYSFREFKQKLFHHYESLLMFEKGIKPKQIFEILNYKNISAFSRSFKSRHGETWQQLTRELS